MMLFVSLESKWSSTPVVISLSFGSKLQLHLLKKIEKVKGLMSNFLCWKPSCEWGYPSTSVDWVVPRWGALYSNLTHTTEHTVLPASFALCDVFKSLWGMLACRTISLPLHSMPSYLRTEFQLSQEVWFGRCTDIIWEERQCENLACTNVIEMQYSYWKAHIVML